MQRRDFAKVLGFGLTLPLAEQPALAEPPARGAPAGGERYEPNTGIYRFTVGGIECHALHAGTLVTAPRQPFFGPEAAPDVFAEQVRRYGVGDSLVMPYNVLLLKVRGAHVLIDAGPGGGPKCRVLRALARLGLAPDDISLVILTHAHFDHQGGLLDENGHRVFTKARHVVFEAEQAFWTGEGQDFSRLRMKPETLLKPARRIFSSIVFDLLQPGDSPLDGLVCHCVPGHTPGHMTVSVEDSGERLYHFSDLCHHAGLLLRNPHWSVGSDVDCQLAVANRLKVLGHLAEQKTRTFGFHMPFPGLGRLAREETGFAWLAEDYQDAGLTS